MQVGHQRKSDYSKTVKDILSFFTFLFKIVTMKHFFQIKNLWCDPFGRECAILKEKIIEADVWRDAGALDWQGFVAKT